MVEERIKKVCICPYIIGSCEALDKSVYLQQAKGKQAPFLKSMLRSPVYQVKKEEAQK